MKTLLLQCRGEGYKVNKKGEITRENSKEWSKNGLFLGVSKHHGAKHIQVDFKEIGENPKKAIGGLLGDKDYGTTRIWGGSYCGKLPRITSAYKNN